MYFLCLEVGSLCFCSQIGGHSSVALIFSHAEGVKRKAEIIKILQERGYTSDPVKAWKAAMESAEQPDEGTSEEEREEDEKAQKGPDYNYLMGMSMWNLIWETAEELLNNRDKKVREREREIENSAKN